MSLTCFNGHTQNYEFEKEKSDFFNNREYLKNFKCCGNKSCDDLAYEYQKLLNKCNDIFSKNGDFEIDEKGKIVGDSYCTTIKEKLNSVKDMTKTFKSFGGKGGKKYKKSNRRLKLRNKIKEKQEKIKREEIMLKSYLIIILLNHYNLIFTISSFFCSVYAKN